MSWSELVKKAERLKRDQERIRAEKLGLDVLQESQQAFIKLIAVAASQLPSKDPEFKDVAALVEEGTSAASEFAFLALRHRKQFPKIYLAPLVRSAIKLRYKGDDRILTASQAHGSRAVLDLFLVIAHAGELDEQLARFLMSHVRPASWKKGRGESPEVLKALRDEVIDAVRQARPSPFQAGPSPVGRVERFPDDGTKR
jgi:hypothetical protein